jgi:hypothetical protein
VAVTRGAQAPAVSRFFASWANPTSRAFSFSPEATVFARMNVCARKHFPIPNSAENPPTAIGSVFVSESGSVFFSGDSRRKKEYAVIVHEALKASGINFVAYLPDDQIHD